MLLMGALSVHPTWGEQPKPGIETETAARATEANTELPQFGGPQSVSGQLQEDLDTTGRGALTQGVQGVWESYGAWKQSLTDDYGLTIGGDYTAMVQKASNSPGEDNAAGGILRVFGNWTVLGKESGNTGSIVFKLENRHRIGTDIAPKDLGFATGYAGFTAPIYADYGWGLTNLYWQQSLNQGRFKFIAGVVDSTDYLDIYGMVNPWSSFSNLAFLTNPTIPAPNQGLGIAGAALLTDHIYVVAGLADSNGDPSEVGDMVRSFFSDREYLKHAEIGWTSSKDRIYLDNVHLSFWHADERDAAQTPSGWGMTFSAATFIDDHWMPFLRAGYANDGGALYERTVSAGLGYYLPARKDLAGIGLNWSRPSEDSFGPDLDNQYTAEAFYRWQVSDHIALTPDLQYIRNPALNPGKDQLWVAGLRARLAF